MISLSDRLKPWEVVAERLVAAARADLAIAIYNPALADPHLAGGRRPRPAARAPRPGHPGGARAATSAARGERVTVTTLAELDPEQVDMRCRW